MADESSGSVRRRAGGGAAAGSPSSQSEGDEQQQQQQEGESPMIAMLRMVFIFMIMRYMMSSTNPTSTSTTTDGQGSPAGKDVAGSVAGKSSAVDNNNNNNAVGDFMSDTRPLIPKFKPHDYVNVDFYVSEEDKIKIGAGSGAIPIYSVSDFEIGNWKQGPGQDGKFLSDVQIDVNQHLANNGSLYMHVFVYKKGYDPNPDSQDYDPTGVMYRHVKMNIHRRRIKVAQTQNLMAGNLLTGKRRTEEEKKEIAEFDNQVISYWYPYFHFSLVQGLPVDRKQLQQLKQYFNISIQDGYLLEPPVYFGEFWHVASLIYPINDTLKTLPLEIQVNHMSLNWFVIYRNVDSQYTSHQELGLMAEEEIYNLKDALLENHPAFLALTFFVSILHSVFDFLAFKNDVQFWRKRKSYAGLSVRSIFMNCFFQLIILLYLFDNDTSYMILISSCIGLVIEIWKIQKAMIVTVDKENPILGMIPRVKFEDRFPDMRQTSEYDEQAFKYLSWFLWPALVCYSIYSLLYEEHKGVYSWIISSLVGAVYTFGFIMMTPQLFINYKLKSTAHLPWRMMTYKALNTFVDDLFAFIIKMPTLHRLACFRDDLIFFIFLYQKWIYPTDYKRLNEFEGGVGFKDDEDEEEEKEKGAKKNQDGEAIMFKIVVIGNGGVGKSSVLYRFVNDKFDKQCFSTIGVEFLSKGVFVDDHQHTLQVWDTAGQERFRTLRAPFYRGADCCFLVFSLDDRESFVNLNTWVNEFLTYADVGDEEYFPFVVIGNKSDISPDDRQVSTYEAEQWCARQRGRNSTQITVKEKNNSSPICSKAGDGGESPNDSAGKGNKKTSTRTVRNFHYIEISAKTGDNINRAFADGTRLILDYSNRMMMERSGGASDSDVHDNSIFIDYSSKFSDFWSDEKTKMQRMKLSNPSLQLTPECHKTYGTIGLSPNEKKIVDRYGYDFDDKQKKFNYCC
eukprot:Nk52_evm56s32 gene=Nk52_evmTU56s32